MTTELKQAAQQALLALEKSQPHPSNPVIGLTKQDFIDHEETIRQLRAAIQQEEAQHPATGEPVAWLFKCYRPGKRIEYASIDKNDTAHWPIDQWKTVECRPLVFSDTHPAPSVPYDVVRDAERYRFIRDADVSDDLIPDIALYAMESLDEYIDAAMLAAK